MVLQYSLDMDEFLPLNLEFDDSGYGNFFADSGPDANNLGVSDLKPNTDDISLLNISSNKPLTLADGGGGAPTVKSETGVDHLLKIIETQEKQNEKMLIQYRLKQVLLDYLRAKQSLTPATTQSAPIVYPSSPPNTPELYDNDCLQFFPRVGPVGGDYSLNKPISSPVAGDLITCSLPSPIASMVGHNYAVETSDMDSTTTCEPEKLVEPTSHRNASHQTSRTHAQPSAVPKKSGRKCAAESKQAQKRSAHLSAEFRYRTKLNDKISKLRNIVGPKSQLSKSGVLGRAIDLIGKLQRTNTKLKEDNSQMRLLLVQACNFNNQMPNLSP